VEGTRRLGTRRKQLPDNLKEKRWYWNWKEEVLDRTVRRTRFGRGCGPAVRQTTGLWFVTGLRGYPLCANLDESPWPTGWLAFSYLNFRSDFPMPHPYTPYKHRPDAQAITVDQYQAKKRFGKHVLTSFYRRI
jgi:hypothetical protein